MIIDKIGHIQDNLYYLGFIECPIYLLDGPQPVIFDAGVTCAGKIYVEAVRSVLGNRQPSLLFLSHVHWDHCGSASFLQKAFPEMKIAAAPMAANILKRPNALALISKLNQVTLEQMSSIPELDGSLLNTEPFAAFEVDMELKNDQLIQLENGTVVQVLSTPGHTQDHHSFYLPDKKILIAGEAAGVFYSSEVVSPEFAYDYDAYLASLMRLAALEVEVFCQGHYYILAGRDEISTFFDKSIRETISFKDRVFELLDKENGSVEKVINRIKAERYDAVPDLKQPEVTYLINLKAKVAHLAGKKQLTA
ncbi:MAG TPA: MBL fold metallo-hydrolase [Syntrophomonadaceae bacterium]|nr:MBL fold metallo-hydrolase [Syntrophomonadaceae bacterium]HPR94407.1 MBL fold metallo-hydrolase [Syntrophomonadaceae bacterium]